LAPISVDSLPYGSLSHSHLHQCLNNLAAGAEGQAPAAFLVQGRLSMETVARVQPELAKAAQTGLEWTVLSWRIRDEQGAMELIQAAENRQASVAMPEGATQATRLRPGRRRPGLFLGPPNVAAQGVSFLGI